MSFCQRPLLEVIRLLGIRTLQEVLLTLRDDNPMKYFQKGIIAIMAAKALMELIVALGELFSGNKDNNHNNI